MSAPDKSGSGAPEPDRIGPYRIEGKLGAGGMGEVYRAWDEHLEREVAIKLIRADQAASPEARKRFLREARAIARLDHSTIVRIHHILEWEGNYCIVMELVEGRTLTELLEDGPFDVQRAAEILRQITEGLEAAHSEGIVHRDLKSGNVMVGPTGQAKILDFGLAKRFLGYEKTISMPGMVAGTPHAMAPEQATGAAVDFKADLFSLGVLAYELLTGETPFRADTFEETLARVLSRRPEPVRERRPEVPEELSELIDHLLEKDPSRRPASARDVALRLEKWTAPAPVPQPLSTYARPENGTDTDIGQIETIALSPQSSDNEAAKVKRSWKLAFGAVVLLVLGVFAPTFFDGPQQPLTLAILGVDGEAESGKSWQSAALVEMLGAELRYHPRLRVIEQKWIDQIPEKTRQTHLGELADVTIRGTWDVSGAEPHLHLDIRWLASGRQSSWSVSAESGELSTLAHRAAKEIEEKLGVQLPDTPTESFTRAFPRDPQALKHYIHGLLDRRTGNDVYAQRHFEAALRVETENPLLHYARSQTLLDLGDVSGAESEARAALEHAADLPASAKLEIEAKSFHILNDWQRAYEAYGELYLMHEDEIVFAIRRAEMKSFFRGEAREHLRDALRDLESLRSHAGGFFSSLLGLAEADVRLQLDEAQRAKELAKSIADTGQRLGMRRLEAEARFIEGKARADLSEMLEALAALGRAWNLYTQLRDVQGMINVSLVNASIHSRNLETSRHQLETTFEIVTERDDDWYIAVVGATLGNVLDELGKYEEAEAILDRSIEIFESFGVRSEAAHVFLSRGSVYQKTGRIDQASKDYNDALTTFQELEDRRSAAVAHINLGELAHWRGDLQEAENRYTWALKIDREIAFPEGEAFDLLRLGEISMLRSAPTDLAAAREQLVDSLELAQTHENKTAIADAQLALSSLETEADNSTVAKNKAKKAEKIYLESGKADEAAMAMVAHGRALLSQQQPELDQLQLLVDKVALQASKSTDHRLGLESDLLSAQLEALKGGEPEKIRSALEALAARAEAVGLVLDAWRIRLWLGKIEIDLGEIATGRERLEAVRAEAQKRGWTLFAHRAEAALQHSGRD